MNILHITDFHFSSESSLQAKVVQSIIKTIAEQNVKIDLVFFTGDLVQSGTKLETFRAASLVLFEELSTKLKIKKENIIFCAGNHDIDRTVIHTATKAYFDTVSFPFLGRLTLDSEVNNFIICFILSSVFIRGHVP